MEIKSTFVSKSLDKKLMIFGFEVPDLLALFLIISVLNFFFGATSQKIYLVWIPSIALALLMRLGKKGKPDNYLIHWLRYQMKPGVLSAFCEPTNHTPPPKLKRM